MINEERIKALNAKLIQINEMTQHLEDGPLFSVPVESGLLVTSVITTRGKKEDGEGHMQIYTYVTDTGGVGKTGIKLTAKHSGHTPGDGRSILLAMDINEMLFGVKVIWGEAINSVHLACGTMCKNTGYTA